MKIESSTMARKPFALFLSFLALFFMPSIKIEAEPNTKFVSFLLILDQGSGYEELGRWLTDIGFNNFTFAVCGALEPSTSVHRFHGVVDGDNAHGELADSCSRSSSVGKPRRGAREVYTKRRLAPRLVAVASSVLAFFAASLFIGAGWMLSWGSLTIVVAGIFAIAGAVAMRTNSNANAR